MSSEATPIQSSATHLVQGSQVPTAAKVQVSGGNPLPAGGNLPSAIARASPDENAITKEAATNAGASAASQATTTAKAAASKEQSASASAQQPNLQVLVAQLNKYLNTTGRPDLYRVDPQSESTIQEVNPANGEVIAQFSASEFPTLARSVGASGLLVDSLA
jgi:HPt (histidine-containing phosphotransfer) domain-containing protein